MLNLHSYLFGTLETPVVEVREQPVAVNGDNNGAGAGGGLAAQHQVWLQIVTVAMTHKMTMVTIVCQSRG